MFGTLSSILRTVFGSSADALKKLAAWIFLIIGVSGIAIAHFAVPIASYPAWHNFLISSGSLLLSAGVFAVLLKSFQYIKVFREEILGAFEDEKFEKILRRILRDEHANKDSRLRAIRILLDQNLATISTDVAEPLASAIAKQIGTEAGDGYFRTFKRTITINAYDATTRQVTLEDEVFIELIPHDPLHPIGYGSSVKGNVGTSIGHLRVNSDDFTSKVQVNGGDVSYNLQLSKSKWYKIDRKYERTYPISADPYIHLMLSRHVLELQVTVVNKVPEKIHIFVRPSGFSPYDPESRWSVKEMDTSIARDGSTMSTVVTKQSLTFPHQGYIIILYDK